VTDTPTDAIDLTPVPQEQSSSPVPSSANEYGDISHVNADYVDIVGEQNDVYNVGNIVP
jgi:hypothetical protein